MLKHRIIPVVLMRNGLAVQSKGFRRHPVLGNPVDIVERLAGWASDELIYLDITRDGAYDLRRDDLAARNAGDPMAIIEDVAARCSMPLTVGGGITSIDGGVQRIERGADKLVLTTAAHDRPEVVTELADRLGSQCVVVGLDVRRDADGRPSCEVDGARRSVGIRPADAARQAVERGAGELLVQSIDRDGRRQGYDVELIAEVSAAVPVPVIALGGVGDWPDLEAGLDAGADAVAAANIFNHVEHAVLKARRWLHARGRHVRPPQLLDEQDLPFVPVGASACPESRS